MSGGGGRAEAIRTLKRSKETKGAFEQEPVRGFLSTGAIAIDFIIGRGGFPKGLISEVFGWEYSGKTTLCLQAAAQAQRDGIYVAYLDAESGVDLEYASRIGFVHDDEDKGLYLRPGGLEETMQIVVTLAESGEVPLIVVDSIPGLVPESVAKGDITDVGPIGALARALSSALPRLVDVIKRHEVALIFVNQMRKVVNSGYRPSYMALPRELTESSSGGSALKFFSSLRIEMRLLKKGDAKVERVDPLSGEIVKMPVANVHEAKVIKSRVGSPYRSAKVTIRYDEDRRVYGIDNLDTVIGICTAQGLVVKSGSHFKVTLPSGEMFSTQGEDALYDYIASRPEIVSQLWEYALSVPGIVSSAKPYARP